MKINLPPLICCVLLAGNAIAAPGDPHADDAKRITLKKTDVIGSQELPRVVSIISWKKTQPRELPLLHQEGAIAFTPVDKKEFAREVAYRRQMQRAD